MSRARIVASHFASWSMGDVHGTMESLRKRSLSLLLNSERRRKNSPPPGAGCTMQYGAASEIPG